MFIQMDMIFINFNNEIFFINFNNEIFIRIIHVYTNGHYMKLRKDLNLF
jgi:hypothetical protein